MAAETTIQTKKVKYISPTKRRAFGIILIVFALAIWLGFYSMGFSFETLTTFKMSPAGSDVVTPDWVFSAGVMMNIMAVICAVMGSYQLARGFGNFMNSALAIGVILTVFAFLTWATAGKSLNLVGLMQGSLLKAVPLTIGAMSGILCERAGVVNIAIEGMMLSGAFLGTVVGSLTKNTWLGLLAAILIGGLLGLIHAVLSIKYKTNQIISGTIINIFSTGITSFLSAKFLQQPELQDTLNNPGIFPAVKIPILGDIPIIGPIFFNNNLFVYAVFIFLILLTFLLYYTRWGLRLRSVGEHPKAADTLGINVFRTRYMAVILGGMMAGFGGAYFTLGSVGRFDEVMTAGRGFIGLAAMIFGNWNPFGAFGSGLIFGFADAMASKLAILQVPIPSEFLLMAPYLATMVVLAGLVGRSRMPAADGEAYEKE